MNLCFTWNNDHFKTKIVSHETFQNLINKFVSCETVNKSFLNKLLIVIKFNNYRFLIRWNDNAFNFEVFENNRKQQNKLYLFRCFNRLNEQNIWLDEWWVLIFKYLCRNNVAVGRRRKVRGHLRRELPCFPPSLGPAAELFLQFCKHVKTHQLLCINKNLQPPKTFFHQLQV